LVVVPSIVSIQNWSDCSHHLEIPYSETFQYFYYRVRVRTQVPVTLYYLGESKLLDDRVKIFDDATLKRCLDSLFSYDPSKDSVEAQILFQLPLPTTFPDRTIPSSFPYRYIHELESPASSSTSDKYFMKVV